MRILRLERDHWNLTARFARLSRSCWVWSLQPFSQAKMGPGTGGAENSRAAPVCRTSQKGIVWFQAELLPVFLISQVRTSLWSVLSLSLGLFHRSRKRQQVMKKRMLWKWAVVVEHMTETGRIFFLEFMVCACINMHIHEDIPHFLPKGRVYYLLLVYVLLGLGNFEVLGTLTVVWAFIYTFVIAWVLQLSVMMALVLRVLMTGLLSACLL